ncbi:MAG: cupin domain-containing protein [Comamonas sp.]|nr:cupin domain-containing protein [Candidatus Comamonas equi]
MTPLPTLVRIETQDLTQATPGQPSRPLYGNTQYRTLESFSAQHGQLSSGVWEATAGAFRSNCAGYVEFCHIVEGRCRVVDPDGKSHSFGAGDSFVLPEGFTGHWEVDERVKKVFFIARTTG